MPVPSASLLHETPNPYAALAIAVVAADEAMLAMLARLTPSLAIAARQQSRAVAV
jgi:hypothetical protein